MDFDHELAAIQADLFRRSSVAKPQRQPAIGLKRKTARRLLRRAKSEAVLAEVFAGPFEMGDSWHVVSHGDIDSLSYLALLVQRWPLDEVVLSTWCMAQQDVDRLRDWIDDGRIGHITFCVGEIFPSQYPDEYWALARLQEGGAATLKVARNHSKVMLGCNAAEGVWFAIESSANVNTNPRIEQTAVHFDRELFEFYRDFFDGIRSIDRATRPTS